MFFAQGSTPLRVFVDRHDSEQVRILRFSDLHRGALNRDYFIKKYDYPLKYWGIKVTWVWLLLDVGHFIMKKILKHLRREWYRYGLETLVVVMGVLIAFSLNNWNENRKNRITEKKILNVVAENLEQNIQNLNRLLSTLEQFDNSGKIISEVIRNGLSDSDSLAFHWHKSILNGANFTLSKSGYESLKNTGIEIITNDKLKTEIVKLYENTYIVLEGRLRWGTEVNPSWDKYITKNFRRGIGEGGKLYPRNLDFIVHDDYFKGLLELAASQRYFFKPFITQSLESSQMVLELVKEELK